jgi:aspartate carbamoyltransferase
MADLKTSKSHSPKNNIFFQKDILSLSQFDKDSIIKLFGIAKEMRFIAKNALPSDILKGTIATLLFYEPSSRTRASFDAAIKQLGGQTVVIENPQQFSSVSKGETFEDTIRVFESYSDLIILRHPEVGSAKVASKVANFVPIINAGDGAGEHPTQALLDMMTIFEHSQKLTDLVGVCGGDIKNGRTIHSLLKGLSLFPNNTIYLLSPTELRLDKRELDRYKKMGLTIIEIENMNQIPSSADFWYWTRVQKERFAKIADYEKVNNKFIVTKTNFNRLAGKDTILLHPLPRVGEIDVELDSDPRSQYLRNQVRNGMYIRMALVALVLGKLKI